jgi:hypothetical protein
VSQQGEIDALRQEVHECSTQVSDFGRRMLRLELESMEKLTRLETQVSLISSSLVTFVSQHQFAPVKLIAYGLAGGVLMTVLGAVLAKSIGL